MTKRKPKRNAVHSLYNGKKTGKRKQRIYTPQFIIDAVLEVFKVIAFDPCSGPDSLVPAKRKMQPPQDGLSVRWPKDTFCNPEYANLKAWLQHKRRHRETIFLVPVRTKRRWFRDLVFPKCEADRPAVCWLDPVRFVGYKGTHPESLCIIYPGDELEAFDRAFSPYGTVTLPNRAPALEEAAA